MLRYRGHRAFAVMVLFCGLLLSAYVAHRVYEERIAHSREAFDRMAHENFLYIEKNLQWYIDGIADTGSYFRSSRWVDTDEFRAFTQPLTDRDQVYDAIGWITTIPPGDAPALTAALKQDGVIVPPAETNLPRNIVTYLTSMDRHSDLAGFDVAADPQFANMLALAGLRRAMVPFAEPPYSLQVGNNPDRMMMIMPVYKAASNHLPQGFAFGVLDVNRIIAASFDPAGNSDLILTVRKVTSGHDGLVVYESKNTAPMASPFQRQEKIDLNGVDLVFSYRPAAAFMDTPATLQSGMIFCLLSLLSVLAFLYLRQMARNMQILQQAHEKAAEASRLKNEFLATMSHEIRSPMSGVLGMAELLMGTEQTPEQQSYTRTILTSGETLMNIIEDILDFSKIEADKLKLDPVAVNLLELADELCALYSPKAREKAIELAVRYVPGSEQFVYADPVRVRQILGNLINNALKFTEKGYVVVTIREDKATRLPDDHVNFLVTVEDTGIGIAEAAQDRIFEKFVQADASTTRDFGGTGLGLSICRRLIEMMGGAIDVESVPGKGSVFRFNLPLRRNREESFIQPKPPVLKDLKILIVDDLAVIRTLLCEQLTMAGMRCAMAESGEEALDRMRQAASVGEPYRMVIIDYLLGGMNGEMLARAICDEPSFGPTCLVMMTAAGTLADSASLAQKGFSAYIAKPVKARTMVETLAIVWGRYREGETDTLIRIDTQSLDRSVNRDAQPKLPGARILLAEDSRVNQAFVQDVLAQLDCVVVTVANGRDALAALKKDAYDIVLMDCQMPVMDGFEATRHIAELKRQGIVRADLPVIALTANAMKGDRRRCLDTGMDDYLSKPVRTRDLKEKVFYWVTHQEASFADEHDAVPPRKMTERKSDNALDEDLLDRDAVTTAHNILKDKYDSMVGYYIEDVAAYIHEMEDALAKGDIEAIIRPAHTIKSTSQRMGARTLSDKAKLLELKARAASAAETEWQSNEVRANLDEISALFQKTQACLLKESGRV